jgi:hypothetical protein
MNNLKILVCAHIQIELPLSNSFLPIQVGAALTELNLGYQTDDVGENISFKNKNYCELTALYWTWQNTKDATYVGLCHYRRFFVSGFKRSLFTKIDSINPLDVEPKKLDLSISANHLHKYDFILGEPLVLNTSVADDYAFYHNKADFDILREVISEKSKDYLNSFDAFFYKTNSYSPYNMFITDKKKLDDYCTWLFTILFEMEKRVTISKDDYQARIFAFLGERLLNLYVYHNNYKVKYLPIIKIGEDKRVNKIVFHFKKIAHNFIFKTSMLKAFL